MIENTATDQPIDRYVVLQYLAEGGMGAIYLGKKLGAGGFEKEVVLKQLLPEFTEQPEFIDLFLREARLSATLDHANIIHTIDLVTAGNEYFMVMEYLAGGDLRTLLKQAKRRKHRFSAAAGIYIAREVLSALAYAHTKIGPHGKPLRLIHRDISPSNILVSGNGEVKLTDFGIAKASTHNSVFYRVKGKVGYMSPEQASNQPIDHRSDLYSLAVCTYEIITGERLFVHAGLTTSAEEIYSQPIELLSKKVAGLPPELDKVMLKALAHDVNHRYQSAGEFQEALLRCAHRCGLMMSAPELAAQARTTCGAPERWRDLEPLGQHNNTIAPGTEIYESGTEQLSVGDVAKQSGDLVSIVDENNDGRYLDDHARRLGRAQTSITNLTRLQGLELTSMIGLADLDRNAGAMPLIDMANFGSPSRSSTGHDDSDRAGDIDQSIDIPAVDPARFHFRNDDQPGETSNRANTADPSNESSRSGTYIAPENRSYSRGRRRPLLVMTLILLGGIGVAAAIGLSGPQLAADKTSTPGQSD